MKAHISSRRCLIVLALAGLASAAQVAPSRAQSSAFSFPEPAEGQPSGRGTDGFEFRPTVDIRVLSLGYYDRGRDGLSLSHPVGIYDARTRRRLAWLSIDERSALSGLFRYRRIRPLLLHAGHLYTIAGFHPGDPGSSTRDLAASDPEGLTMAPEIGYQSYKLKFGNTLQFPDASAQGTFFGPNFQFRVAKARPAVKRRGPEPGVAEIKGAW